LIRGKRVARDMPFSRDRIPREGLASKNRSPLSPGHTDRWRGEYRFVARIGNSHRLRFNSVTSPPFLSALLTPEPRPHYQEIPGSSGGPRSTSTHPTGGRTLQAGAGSLGSHTEFSTR
jgi:hypothetical protein